MEVVKARLTTVSTDITGLYVRYVQQLHQMITFNEESAGHMQFITVPELLSGPLGIRWKTKYN